MIEDKGLAVRRERELEDLIDCWTLDQEDARLLISKAGATRFGLAGARRKGDAVNGGRLDFLWLELTNRCNLQCVHCYTESHPGSGDRDVLTTAQYESVMRQAYALGCRRLQFIGGEPQLHPDFLRLLGVAKETGFEFIEVFTNLMRLRDDTLRFAADAGIRFATSVYSDDPAVHNAITKVGSSHVIDPSCGPDSETCPQSSEPPGCPQSGEPPGCPQSPA